MLAFKCPACRTTVRLPDSARGERIVCGHCGEAVFVAGSSEPSQSTTTLQSLPAAVVVERGPHRRRKQPSAWKLLPHVLIAGVTAYAAWRMYDATVNRPFEQRARVATLDAPKMKPRRIQPKAPPKVVPKIEATPEPLKTTPVPDEPTPPSPFAEDVPTAVVLPPVTDDQVAKLVTGHRDCNIELLTNSKDLSRDSDKLLWKGDLIAGLRFEKGSLQFRWMKSIPMEAEAAVRTSVIRLTAAGENRFIAMRAPIMGEPLMLDLTDASHRVNGKCDWMPPVEEIRFGLTLAGQVPVKKLDGPKTDSLAFRDETIIIYDFNGDAATKVTMRKVGDVLAATFASQYVLPSGDVEPLSISRGNRMMTKLQNLQADATDAAQSLPRLQTYRRNLDGDLRQAQNMIVGARMSGGGYIENPVAVAKRESAIRAVQSEIMATERNVVRAARLVDDRLGINADVNAMQQVAALARSIDKAPLPYRFYIIVGGHEVDLVRWSPEKQAIDALPAVLAQPVH